MAAPAAEGARAQHAAWSRRDVPAVEEVRDGVWSIPTRVPDSPLGYVLAYALRTPEGLALIDTGVPHDAAWADLEAGIRASGHRPEDVRDVLVTHNHFDHHGLTPRLVALSGARVHLHARDSDELRRRLEGDAGPPLEDWFAARGAGADDAAEIAEAMRRAESTQRYGRLEPSDHELAEGERPIPSLPALRALWTPGHTDGHVCFVLESERLLFSGDHVLPRITSHVTRPPGAPEGQDPLTDYLGSLARVRDLDIAEVLPAHEYRFADLAGRIDEMLAHHEERLAEIARAIAPGASTWEVAQTISWSRGWDATAGLVRLMAVNETYSHLRHLETTRRARRTGRNPDRWAPAA